MTPATAAAARAAARRRGEGRKGIAEGARALFCLSLSLSLRPSRSLEQCKARVNGANMRGGQAGVTALSQVKSRLTPLITQI